MDRTKTLKKSFWLMFLCWLAYMSAYIGRYSYNSNITPIIEFFGTTHSEAGMVTTCFFFAYGAGQVINGLCCKYYNKRCIIAGVLIFSAGLNLAVFFGIPFAYIKYLWLFNGLAQSVLWPTLIFVLAHNLCDGDLKKAILVMSTTVAAGTLITYGCSALFALFDGFKYSFLLGAIIMSIVGCFWFAMYNRVTEEKTVETQQQAVRQKTDKSVWFVIVVLGFMAIVDNLVKDGLTTWVPSILKENFGFNDSLSICMALVLPILGMLGAFVVTGLKKYIHSFISLTGLMFLFSTVCLLTVTVLLDSSLWLIILSAFGLISLFMHGANNIITSMAPMYLRDKVNSGMMAGVLNGCCYVGSTISSYGLGAVADSLGWNGVFYFLLGISCIPLVLSAGIGLFGKFKNRQPKN